MSACGSVSSILLFHSLTLLPVAEVNEGSLASKREGMEGEAEEDRTKRTGRVGTLTARPCSVPSDCSVRNWPCVWGHEPGVPGAAVLWSRRLIAEQVRGLCGHLPLLWSPAGQWALTSRGVRSSLSFRGDDALVCKPLTQEDPLAANKILPSESTSPPFLNFSLFLL